MRLFLLAVLLTASLAGCAEDSQVSDEGPDVVDPAPMAQLPANFTASANVVLGADPFNLLPATPVGGGTPCSTAVSACYYHEFTVNETSNSATGGNGTDNFTVDVRGRLTWGNLANDFDLYLYQGTALVSQDGINMLPPATVGPPAPNQVLNHAGLLPGVYTFWVVAWNAVADGYVLHVEFTSGTA